VASIRTEISIDAHPDVVWDAVRDVGALHQRLVPGFVVDTRLEDGARIVTFASGLVVRELIVDLDDRTRRLAWAARGGRLAHHNASAQVLADGDGRTRLVWIADLLPDEVAGDVRAMMEHGAAVMKKTLEGCRAL
jgi:carbon monoxide dehydrogenase subunit G